MSVPEVLLSTCLVEFGPLDDHQQGLVDMHPLRALGSAVPVETDGTVIEFWLDGAQPEDVFDDLRGWAIGNGLPIRRLVT